MIPRLLEARVIEALRDRPVVLITGPRQSGKTTLARSIPGYAYVTLDSLAALDAARSDPEGFVAGLPDRTVIDEVQRTPGLFLAIKAAVDRNRAPGRFLLTGSTSATAMPRAADALVGRMELLTLWPLSLREIEGGSGSVCDRLFEAQTPWTDHEQETGDLAGTISRGGYPEPLAWEPHRRAAWIRDYVATVVQRDIRDLSDIAGLTAIPRLLSLLASRCANLLNVSDIARSLGLPYATLSRYLALLQAVYLWSPVASWSVNLGSRVAKAPKVALCDTGLACGILGLDADQLRAGTMLGPLLENLAVMELRKDAAWSRTRPALYHYRDDAGREGDITLEEPGGQAAGG